ncbi:MAG TPA: hypothetical protein GX714_05350 [Chloroflexi bacterium]|jgi:succinate-acetate transporter protein|nr:hypothetical protein [Chloroflexota bacterium]
MKGNGRTAIREKERAVPVYRDEAVVEEVERVEAMEAARPAVETHISLQPIAAPMILGLYALASGVFLLGSTTLGWFTGSNDPGGLFPFIGVFAGLAQLLAAMWSYRARDGLGTVLHGFWGSLWLAYGIGGLLVALGALPSPVADLGEFGLWLLIGSAITLVATVAAAARSIMLTLTMAVLTISSILATIGYLTDGDAFVNAGAIGFIATAVLSWYVASSLLLDSAFGRHILPVGRFRSSRGYDVVRGYGEPGVTPYE